MTWQKIRRKGFQSPKPKDVVPYLNFSELENKMAELKTQC